MVLRATKAEEAALERIAGLPAASELGQVILKELRLAAERGDESDRTCVRCGQFKPCPHSSEWHCSDCEGGDRG